MTTLASTHQSKSLAQWAVERAATYSITTELGKWVTSKSSKVSTLDCVCLTKGATKDPCLILGSLERALCHWQGNVINGVTESPPCMFWCLPYLLSISTLSLSVEFQALWHNICLARIKEPSPFPYEALQLVYPLQRMFSYPDRFKRTVFLISWD